MFDHENFEIKKNGPLKLKIDDKNGLVKEGLYKTTRQRKKGRGRRRQNRKEEVPRICSKDGDVPCQRVDSRVVPPLAEEERMSGDKDGEQ